FDRNPLLANFGRVGREMALQVEESQVLTIESYEIPQAISEFPQFRELLNDEAHVLPTHQKATLLNALQGDFLFMRHPAQGEKIHLNEDQSLQILTASTPMREVQVVYDTIMGLIHNHSTEKEKILPEDIIVMAPDIIHYEPYIRAVFSQNDNIL